MPLDEDDDCNPSRPQRFEHNRANDSITVESGVATQNAVAASAVEECCANEQDLIACAAKCAAKWPAILLDDSMSPRARATRSEGPSTATAQVVTGVTSEMPDEEIRVLRADVQRTRASDPVFHDPMMQQRLEKLITSFCLQEQVKYMQGFHEVAAVFALVQTFARDDSFGDATALACLTSFVYRFIPYFHDGDTFVSLHISLLFFRQLILYHHPELHNFLAEAGVSPFLYATPWYITLFAAKTPMALVLRLWERYLVQADAVFLPFLAVAVLAAAKQEILSVDPEDVHGVVLRVGICTTERLDSVWEAAAILQARTPRSLGLRLSRLLVAVREKCPRNMSAADEPRWSEHVLERVENERRFLVLAEEVAELLAHESPATTANKVIDQNQQQVLRFLVLDVRSSEEYAEQHLPAALHFCPPCLRRLSAAFNRGSQSQIERIAAALSAAVTGGVSFGNMIGATVSSGSSSASVSKGGRSAHAVAADQHRQMLGTSGLPPARAPWAEPSLVEELFAELQKAACTRWGEAWLSESACFHLVLIGGTEDTADSSINRGNGGDLHSGAVAPLYEILTEHLALARVSVAMGGAASVHREMIKNKLELVSTPKATVLADVAGNSTEPEAVANPNSDQNLWGSAWSRLQAASEALPARDAVGARLGGFMKSSRGAARKLAEKAADGVTKVREQAPDIAAAVRHQAPELAANARQRAAEGIFAAVHTIEELSKDEETLCGLKADTWACQAWASEVNHDLDTALPTSSTDQIRLRAALLHLNSDGLLSLMEPARRASIGGGTVVCSFDVARLYRIDATPSKEDVLSFFFPRSAQRRPGVDIEQDQHDDPFDETRPLLVARFSSTERARACAKAVTTLKRSTNVTPYPGGYPNVVSIAASFAKGAIRSAPQKVDEASAVDGGAANCATVAAPTSPTSEEALNEAEKLVTAPLEDFDWGDDDVDQDAEDFLRALDERATMT